MYLDFNLNMDMHYLKEEGSLFQIGGAWSENDLSCFHNLL